MFDWLAEQKENIENEFGELLSWERMEERRASRVAIYREGSIEDSEEMLIEIRAWAVQKLLILKKVFSQRLKSYKKQVGV